MSKSETLTRRLHNIKATLAGETGAEVTAPVNYRKLPRKPWGTERYVPKMFDSFTDIYVRQAYIISHLRPGPVQMQWKLAQSRALPRYSTLFKVLRESYGIDISAADLVDELLPTVAPEIIKIWQTDAELLNRAQNT